MLSHSKLKAPFEHPWADEKAALVELIGRDVFWGAKSCLLCLAGELSKGPGLHNKTTQHAQTCEAVNGLAGLGMIQ